MSRGRIEFTIQSVYRKINFAGNTCRYIQRFASIWQILITAYTYTRAYARAHSQSGIICSQGTKSFMRTLYEFANTRLALFIFRTLFLLIIECCLARRTMEHRLCWIRPPSFSRPLVLKGRVFRGKISIRIPSPSAEISNKSHQNNYLRTLNELES